MNMCKLKQGDRILCTLDLSWYYVVEILNDNPEIYSEEERRVSIALTKQDATVFPYSPVTTVQCNECIHESDVQICDCGSAHLYKQAQIGLYDNDIIATDIITCQMCKKISKLNELKYANRRN